MPATDHRFHAAVAAGPVLLDAAMGTRLMASGLDLRVDDPALWVVDRPDAVADCHRRDVAAGSGALTTNSFGANPESLARFGRSAESVTITRAAVALARAAAGPDRLVLGSIGPTACPEGLTAQADALVGAGVDALVLETFTADQARSALQRLTRRGYGPPVVVSLWQPPDPDVARGFAADGAAAVGINCVDGMAAAVPIAGELRRAVAVPLWVKPAAGRPGESHEAPETFARRAASLRSLGSILVGGCCGTTEAHVAALREALAGVAPSDPDQHA